MDNQEKLEILRYELNKLEARKKEILGEMKALYNNRTCLSTEPKKRENGDTQTYANLTTQQKISLFLTRFGCRQSVYPKYWHNEKTGKSGYSPVCKNEWIPGLCKKPKIKCSTCPNQAFHRLDERAIDIHLRGQQTIGTYAIREDDTCIFLACDFDGTNWLSDVMAFKKAAMSVNIESLIERSRSGNGGHIWIFFNHPILAKKARKLGDCILSKAMSIQPNIKLETYDRFFPNQDTLPKGGFGNLIALPLQKNARKLGNSVFVDESGQLLADQWNALQNINTYNESDIDLAIQALLPESNLSQIPALTLEEELEKILDSSISIEKVMFGETLILTLGAQIAINIRDLPPSIINGLKRTATFANPTFFELQRLRFSTWKTPRYIFCGDNDNGTMTLPRGCLPACQSFLEKHSVQFEIKDNRNDSGKIRCAFRGKLRSNQKTAVNELLKYDIGILCAEPGTGKTVKACAMISKRKVSTLILVHRTSLLDQWKKELLRFTSLPEAKIGMLGGNKSQLKGHVDIAMLQSLASIEDLLKIVSQYDQVIVDECHHIAAVSFERILKTCPAKYVLGLTATPYRKDGLLPIIKMQCGPIRFELKSDHATLRKQLILREVSNSLPDDDLLHPPVHVVWEHLANSVARNAMICTDIISQIKENRTILVISERKDHLNAIKTLLHEQYTTFQHIFLFEGSLGHKARRHMISQLNDLSAQDHHFCILATGALIGEGFNMPKLDTLFLAMPISFKGKLIQYTGRLHRSSENKKEVRVFDYIDDLPLTRSMFQKRLKAYKTSGYQIPDYYQKKSPSMPLPGLFDNPTHQTNFDITAH